MTPPLASDMTMPVLTLTPWGQPVEAGRIAPLRGRPCLLTPPEVEQVFASSSRETLPELEPTRESDGRLWKCFELPAFGLEEDAKAESERIELTLVGGAYERRTLTVFVADDLARPSQDESHGDAVVPAASGCPATDQSISSSNRLSAMTEDLIDRHIDFVNELYDDERNDRICWEGNTQGIAIRSLQTALDQWVRSGDTNEPRMALIVRLAAELAPTLSDVCRRPRRVLSRVRQLQAAGRIQQVDGGCLRWLARQPGRTVAEKSGVKQQVMGVVRIENEDTPENRVVKDLIVRAIHTCNRYIREHKDAVSHARVLSVIRFRMLLRRLLTESPLGSVGALSGIAQPNYVLLHDARYRVLWQAYVKLVRHQMLEDSIWRWRHRLWLEHCRIALLDALRGLYAVSPASRSDILLHLEQDAGQFVDGRTHFGAWVGAAVNGERIDLVPAHHVAKHPLIPRELRNSRPDHVLVRRSKSSNIIRVVAIYGLFDFDPTGSRTEAGLEWLSSTLPGDGSATTFRGLLMRPNGAASVNAVRQPVVVEADRCRGAGLSLPLQVDRIAVRELVEWALSSN